MLRAWCRLGFGEQQAHGVRSPGPSGWVAPAGLVVRGATRADVPALARLDLELPAHQGRSPVCVAERDGTVVGSAVGCPVTRSGAHAGLARPDGAALLAFAAVQPAARGMGVGRVLAESAVAWAAECGFVCVATDWRTTNLLSSRVWPALGFEETFLRLHRLVGY